MLGQWYTSMKESRAALKAWNKGRPILSLETSQYASEHHAQYWARWAKELVMEQQLQYSPASRSLAAVVHKEFWVAVMRAHGLPDNDPQYWYPLVAVSCMEGNMAVLDAFAQVFDAATVSQWAQNFSFIHPRVVGWQFEHGYTNTKNAMDLLSVQWDRSDFMARDAMTFAQGGPVMLDWVRAWTQLPDALISPQNAMALLQWAAARLRYAEAEPGIRADDGMPTLRQGHQYRKCRNWRDASHIAAPLLAGDALRMIHAIYRRFGMEAVVMDALIGRWTQEDLHDPRVCAVLYVNHVAKEGKEHPMPAEQWLRIRRAVINESLMLQALEWAMPSGDRTAMYNAALPFFRKEQAQQELAQRIDLAGLFEEPVF